MTLHEVKQVEAGRQYLMQRYLKVRFVEVYSHESHGSLLFWKSEITGGTVDAAIARGAKFYGPIELKPAQESAAGGKRL